MSYGNCFTRAIALFAFMQAAQACISQFWDPKTKNEYCHGCTDLTIVSVILSLKLVGSVDCGGSYCSGHVVYNYRLAYVYDTHFNTHS